MLKNSAKNLVRIINRNRKGILSFIIMIGIMTMLSVGYFGVVLQSVSKYNGVTIVLDAGHGGRDGGSVGFGGTVEKDINLKYVLSLKDKLVKQGYRVVLTRKNDDGLYSEFASNKKMSDMKARLRIIQESNPNLIISIHMNSFSSPNAKGATTYYRSGDDSGKTCADLIQKSLHTYCSARSEASKVGDYYMLNSSYYTSILIECGFISNPEEERMLNSNEYRDKMVNAITNGILLYFGSANI